jgi:dienelactone hydrolase
MNRARRGGALIAPALAVALLWLSGAARCAAEDLPQRELTSALSQLADNYPRVEQRMGREAAADLEERLFTDLGEVALDNAPEGYPASAWRERLEHVAAMDASIVAQVVGTPMPVAGSHGLVERLVVAHDGTLQPFALYVPDGPTAAGDRSLVVLLHGRPQTESEILGSPYFRTLADRTGTMIAAPWGRGIYDFGPPGDDEVYQVATMVASAFGIPARRVFLAGYSMGGFSVFKIGPEHPEQWAGVMCISGSVLNSGADAVRSAFARTRMYVVTGTLDDSIPTQYPQGTAAYLESVGIPTALYVEPAGTHGIYTLIPSLTRAWTDMLAGRLGGIVPGGTNALPAMAPPGLSTAPRS